MVNILVGADPEVFVQKEGHFLSAFGLIKGDKKNPFKVDKGAVQVDGMALEFNIDPAGTEDEFCINIQSVFNTLRGMVPEYNVVATPVAFFSEDHLKQQPAEALDLGCDPDYNAWTLRENVKPVADKPMRTASGHVHIGFTENEDPYTENHVNRCAAIVKQLDFFLGLPSLLYDKDTQRRSLYGKAGACRFKPYGVEYRVLSNMWLNSENLMRWVFRNTKEGVERLINGECFYEKYGDIQEIINTSDVDKAIGIIKDAGIRMPEGV